jgi:hypothetical protein
MVLAKPLLENTALVESTVTVDYVHVDVDMR